MQLSILHANRWILPLLLVLCIRWPGTAYAALPQRPLEFSPPRFAPLPTTGAIDNLDAVPQAVVRIEVEGTFVDPQDGRLSGVGGGTGFLLDARGKIVTNSHVVAGAASLKVYVPGHADPYPAYVLGVNECADLAVIQIEGEDFPYLAWSEREIKARMPVEAVGYAFGEVEPTVTPGTVERVHASGETDWASLKYVLQHGATLNPGNSGGPLVDETGRVVGINYASNHQTDRYFAISREQAGEVIERLGTGVNQHAIGINGRALTDGKTYAGIWVYSVQSGSPAGNTGVLPGDFLVEMAGEPLGTGGTLQKYCEIVRSHREQDVVSIKVIRDQVVWEGELNGEPLHPVDLFTPTPEPTPTPLPDGYHFAEVSNEVIHARLPAEWADTRIDDWVVNGDIIGKAFHASADLSQGWSAPGISVYSATDWQGELDLEKALDVGEVANYCTYNQRFAHEHTAGGYTYRGVHDVWRCSADEKSYDAYVRLAAASDPSGQVVIISFRGLTVADTEAWSKLIASFYMVSNPDEPASMPPSPTPTPQPPTATPVPTSTSTSTTGSIFRRLLRPTPAPQAFAVVKIAKLNIRTGPSTDYGIIGSLNQNERLPVLGRADQACSWLQVQLTDGKTAWIGGPPTYATLEGNCSDIPPAPPPPPPPKPCVRFDNHFNKVADVTLTMPDNLNWKPIFFNIAPHRRSMQCLPSGRYTYSVGVPNEISFNGEFTLQRGGRTPIISIH